MLDRSSVNHFVSESFDMVISLNKLILGKSIENKCVALKIARTSSDEMIIEYTISE